ncbi:MAG: glutathione S-transferase N-terminal domain-containing protein [Pseudomonadales bacterium]
MTVLHQFAYSHFNEKARWALDFKNVSHQRQTYLPGPHMPAIKKISGQTQTPVLERDGEYVAGSAAIIDLLEREYATPALYPQDTDARNQALALQAEFDQDLGPATRTVIFSALVEEGGYLCRMFAGSKGLLQRTAYRVTFPLARGLIAKRNGVTTPGNIERCIATTFAMLDRVAEQTSATGYLVGEQFSVADLTAAALLAPVASVDHPDMKRPQPLPQRVTDVVSQFTDHPGVAWVNEIYRRHRGA